MRVGALCSLSAALGSMHAFSVLLASLEDRLDVSRGRASFIYALGLVSLTAGVRLFGDWPEGRRRSTMLPAAVGLAALAGLALASATSSYWVGLGGFGVVFGLANGVGYAATLESSALGWPARSGAAMALVTAAYAVGAAIASVGLDRLAETQGAGGALLVLGAAVASVGVVVSLVLRSLPALHDRASTHKPSTDQPNAPRTAVLWIAYGLSVVAGLMALGHAAEIVRGTGAGDEARRLGVVLLTVGNAVGGFAMATVADRMNLWRLIAALPLVACGSLIALAIEPGVVATIAMLTIVGVTYGAIIAVYPFAILRLVGADAYPSIYGRVFTAWAVAGLGGPFLAGTLFDQYDSYQPALVVAAVTAAVASLWIKVSEVAKFGGENLVADDVGLTGNAT